MSETSASNLLQNTIASLGTSAKFYEDCRNDRALPQPLHEVGQRLCLGQQAFKTIQKQLGAASASRHDGVIKPLKDASSNVELLEGMLKQVANGPRTSWSVAKASIIMHKILKDAYDLMRGGPAIEGVTETLQNLLDAINKLSGMEPSMQGKDLGDYVCHFGSGDQINNTGTGMQFINKGNGTQVRANVVHFGGSPR